MVYFKFQVIVDQLLSQRPNSKSAIHLGPEEEKSLHGIAPGSSRLSRKGLQDRKYAFKPLFLKDMENVGGSMLLLSGVPISPKMDFNGACGDLNGKNVHEPKPWQAK
jgi:hypothetical protein